MRSLLLLALCTVTSTASAQGTPPQRLDLAQDAAQGVDTVRGTTRPVRNAFVRDQTILGLAVYGPSFAAMVGDGAISATAGYLVMAGGTFFAAAELTRRVEMSEAQQMLATRMAWRTAGAALYIATSPDVDRLNRSAVGAATLLGGFGGTAAGLLVGKGLTPGEAVATAFGHDLAFAVTGTLLYVSDPPTSGDEGISDQTRAVAMTAGGMGGYALGRLYAGRAPYNVTVGDVKALWLGAAIGATAAATAIVETDPRDEVIALSVLAGGLAGTYLADRMLVRRYDHSRSEGNMLALGGVAGGLMGVGVGVLVAGEAEREGAVTLGFATLGAIGGVILTERFLQPSGDEGRRRLGALGALGDRLQLDPAAIAAAAAGMRGHHTFARITF